MWREGNATAVPALPSRDPAARRCGECARIVQLRSFQSVRITLRPAPIMKLDFLPPRENRLLLRCSHLLLPMVMSRFRRGAQPRG